MDFKNGAELLELCREHRCSISEIMRQRECDLGETTPDTLQTKMERILEIMRESASAPIKTPPRYPPAWGGKGPVPSGTLAISLCEPRSCHSPLSS